MELFNRILRTAVDGGASDVHVKVGGPIVFRIDGNLVDISSQAYRGVDGKNPGRHRSCAPEGCAGG